MAKQAERRAATRAAILAAARHLMGQQGFAATSMDEVAAQAGLAKGAVYHHFPSKAALFEAVFEAVSADLAQEVAAAARNAPDVLAAMVAAIRFYFTACAEGERARVILQDGPAVLGWGRWREIDEAYFGGGIPRGLAAAMEQGLVARQPVEPLARLLLGAVTEGAMACAGRSDLPQAAAGYAEAAASLVESLRRR